MAESQKNSGGCGDCGDCGCKVGEKKADTDNVRSAYGKAVASAAIKEMSGKSDEGTMPIVDEAEVMAFINECIAAKEDVVTVVEHIANREGINLWDDCAPRDADKSRLWAFLSSVLKTFTIELAKAAVNMLVSGELSWKDMIGLTGDMDNERRSPNKVNDGKFIPCNDMRCMIRGNRYATVFYAFKR